MTDSERSPAAVGPTAVSDEGDVLCLLRSFTSLARQLARLHDSGRFHGNIGAATLQRSNAGQLTLDPPADDVTIRRCVEERPESPLELDHLFPLTIPSRLDEARDLLKAHGVSVSPIAIDLFQLGAYLCRQLTGTTARSYLSSPLIVSHVPSALRLILDGALGVDASRRFKSAAALVAELDNVVAALAGERTALRSDAAGRESVGDEPSSVVEAASVADTTATGCSNERPRGEDLPFDRLGHYQILDRIGQGGMGDVYLGYEPELDREVAIKVLPQEFAREPDFERRFRQEAAAAARLSHPHIVQVFFAGEDAGHLFFAMQLVRGDTLASRLAKKQNLSVDETLRIIRDVLSALSAAHAQGLVHRDVKPGNVLLESSGRALLGDFGLVKSHKEVGGRTGTGVIMGTVDYISPEQGRGQTVDARSDLYSLGVMAYQLVSGRLPFEADSPTAMIFQHVYEQPPLLSQAAPDVAPALQAMISKLMQKAPEVRYQTAEDVLADIDAFLAGDALPSGADAIPPSIQGKTVTVDLPFITDAAHPQQTTVVTAPYWPEERLPELADKDQGQRHWWSYLAGRIQSRLLRHVPQKLVQQIQNTYQQLDGVVRTYERRRDELQGLIKQAEACLLELTDQQQDWRNTINAAEEQLATAADEQEHQQILDKAVHGQAVLRVLEEQLAKQQDQLGKMHVQADRLDVRVQQMVHQRNLLNARLKAAHARANLASGTLSSDLQSRRKRKILVLGAVSSTLMLATLIIFWSRQPNQKTPNAPVSSAAPNPAITSVPANPGQVRDAFAAPDPNRFSNVPGYQRFLAYTMNVRSVAFDPSMAGTDEILLAVGFDQGEVRRYTFDREELNPKTVRYLSDASAIRSLAYAPDGDLLAAGDASGVIRIWQSAQRKGEMPYRVLRKHAGEVTYLWFNADGSELISVGDDNAARLWDIIREREIEIVETDSRISRRMSILAGTVDAGTVLLAPGLSSGDRVLYFGDSVNGSIAGFEDTQFKKLSLPPSPVVLNAVDQNRQTGVVPRRINLWDPVEPENLQTLGEGIVSTGVSAEGSVAVSAVEDGSLVAWDLSDRQELARIRLPGRTPQHSFHLVAVSPHGEFAATCGSDAKILHLWRIPRPEPPPPPGRLRTYYLSGEVHTVALSPSAAIAAAGSPTGLKYWKFDEPLTTKGSSYDDPSPTLDRSDAVSLGRPVTTLTFTPTGAEIIYGTGQPRSDNNVLAMTSLERYVRRATKSSIGLRRFEGHTDRITGAALIDQGRQLLSCSRDRTVRVWSLETGLEESQVELDVPANSLAVSPDQNRFLLGTDDTSIRLYQIEGMQEMARLPGHTFLVLDVGWSPNGSHFVSAGADRTVRVWNAETLETVAVLRGHTDRVNSAVVLGWGRHVVSGSDDRTVRYWDVDTREELAVFKGHEGPVTAVDVDSYGSRAVSSSLDTTVMVWDLEWVRLRDE